MRIKLLKLKRKKVFMKIRGTEIVDTFAEAFEMVCAKVIITAKTDDLAIAAANSMTGFATSVIGCKCEAAIDVNKNNTPDNRPGYSVLIPLMKPD